MQVKKFLVKTIEEGWIKVYKELGENPVILSVKELNGQFEIVAAKSISIDTLLTNEEKIQHKKLFGKFINFLGGIGVGKTTTLAKIAALLKFEKKKNVAVLTLDLYKVGAVETVRNLCNLMQIPCIPVKDTNELDKLKPSLTDYEHVLIDYPSNLLEVPEALEIFSKFQDSKKVENLLIIAADKKESVINKEIEAFSIFDIDSVVITKADQISKDELYQMVKSLPYKVSFICDGYQIPNDLKEPQAILKSYEVANA